MPSDKPTIAKNKGSNLSAAIIEACKILKEIRLGKSMTEAIQLTELSIRPAAQSLAYNALRNKPRLLLAISGFISRAIDAPVEDVLLVSASTLLPHSPNKYNSHTLVNEAVNAATKSSETIAAKGLINAVLRRLCENPQVFSTSIQKTLNFYPDWWVKKIKQAYPEDWLDILDANATHPPMSLRVNQRKFSETAYAEQLEKDQIKFVTIPSEIKQLAKEAICLEKPLSVGQLPGFWEGSASIQDIGAQVAAHLLAPKAGERILDACAAPGGKTAHLLELADIDLLAIEKDEIRIKKIQENLDRLGLEAEIKVGDAADYKAWWDGRQFDAILADVPCSASGIVRRHPDIPYLRRPEDIKQLAILQKQIVSSLWQTLKPGGRLLYVTCSIFPEEGENQSKWVLENCPDAVRLQTLGQILPSKWHDGFFYALFRKQA